MTKQLVLLASHGNLAAGMASAVEVIIGKRPQLRTAAPYTGDMDELATCVNCALTEVGPGGELIIITDLDGGSVNNTMLPFVAKGNVQLVTGMNLGLVLEVLLSAPTGRDAFAITVDRCRQGIRLVNVPGDISDEEF